MSHRHRARAVSAFRSRPTIQALERQLAERAALRNCGPCLACCTIIPVDSLHKPARQDCSFGRPGLGCTRYETRPRDCRVYACWWRTGLLGDADRPDLVGLLCEGRVTYGGQAAVVHEVWPGAWGQDAGRDLLERVVAFSPTVVALALADGQAGLIGKAPGALEAFKSRQLQGFRRQRNVELTDRQQDELLLWVCVDCRTTSPTRSGLDEAGSPCAPPDWAARCRPHARLFVREDLELDEQGRAVALRGHPVDSGAAS